METIVARVYVQFYVVNEASTSTASVNVTQDGKAKNVHYGMMNARSRIATVMGIVSMENVLVSEATKVNSVETSTALTQLAPVTVSVSRGPVSARKVGKVLTVLLWIRTLFNVFLTVLDMAPSTLIRKHALVTQDGPVMTVLKRFVILIAVYTEDVWESPVYVILVGLENFVHRSYVTLVVATTVNVRTALVSACPVGMAAIAHWKAVREAAPVTDSVKSQMTVNGPANASTDGTVQTARLSKNKSVTMEKTMTKMALSTARIQSAA